MRTLAIAALIFAIARPLASGLLGLTGGGKVDTTIVLLDRSPSMQQLSVGGISKLETGRRQLADAFATLGSAHWVAIDSAGGQAQSYESLDGLMNSVATQPSSATAYLPAMMQEALDYLETNSAVNAKKVGIEGVSRYGKVALVTMAFEPRFSIVLVGSSGEGGAKLHRRNFGEAVENLTGSGEYHWMAGNFLGF